MANILNWPDYNVVNVAELEHDYQVQAEVAKGYVTPSQTLKKKQPPVGSRLSAVQAVISVTTPLSLCTPLNTFVRVP